MSDGGPSPGSRRQRVYCDCCRGWSTRPGFCIVRADGGGAPRVCTRCASHISLKADGAIWMPEVCPDAPHPRLRVFRKVEEVKPGTAARP